MTLSTDSRIALILTSKNLTSLCSAPDAQMRIQEIGNKMYFINTSYSPNIYWLASHIPVRSLRIDSATTNKLLKPTKHDLVSIGDGGTDTPYFGSPEAALALKDPYQPPQIKLFHERYTITCP